MLTKQELYSHKSVLTELFSSHNIKEETVRLVGMTTGIVFQSSGKLTSFEIVVEPNIEMEGKELNTWENNLISLGEEIHGTLDLAMNYCVAVYSINMLKARNLNNSTIKYTENEMTSIISEFPTIQDVIWSEGDRELNSFARQVSNLKLNSKKLYGLTRQDVMAFIINKKGDYNNGYLLALDPDKFKVYMSNLKIKKTELVQNRCINIIREAQELHKKSSMEFFVKKYCTDQTQFFNISKNAIFTPQGYDEVLSTLGSKKVEFSVIKDVRLDK